MVPMHPASNASRFQPDDGPRPFAAEPAVGITTYGPLSASRRRAPGDNARAMVLPVTMRGMIDPPAIRSLLMP
jgi:hypothetical protein